MDIFRKLTWLENEASQFGFKWETAAQIMDQIQSEISEVDVHLEDGDKTKLQEEIGDLLHAVFSLCIFCQFDPNETLNNSINKFEQRFKLIQNLARQEGLNHLNGQDFKKLMSLWNQAKELSEK